MTYNFGKSCIAQIGIRVTLKHCHLRHLHRKATATRRCYQPNLEILVSTLPAEKPWKKFHFDAKSRSSLPSRPLVMLESNLCNNAVSFTRQLSGRPGPEISSGKLLGSKHAMSAYIIPCLENQSFNDFVTLSKATLWTSTLNLSDGVEIGWSCVSSPSIRFRLQIRRAMVGKSCSTKMSHSSSRFSWAQAAKPFAASTIWTTATVVQVR